MVEDWQVYMVLFNVRSVPEWNLNGSLDNCVTLMPYG